MKLRLTALLCALCLLTGCAAGASASSGEAQSGAAASSAPAEEGSAVPEGPADAESAPEGSESAAAVPDGGSADGLSWTFETKKFSTTESSGREVYYYSLVYPVFAGENSDKLNGYVQDKWLMYMDEAEQQAGEDDSYLDGYTDYMTEEELSEMLPFYDQMNLDTVWVDERYVSLSGDTGFWSGGAHPYFYRISEVLSREDGHSVALSELVDLEQLPELVREHFPEDEYTDDEEWRQETIDRVAAMADSPEAFRLEEGGVRLFYNVGDAVPRLEIFLNSQFTMHNAQSPNTQRSAE